MKKKFIFVNLTIDGGYHGVHHGIAFLVPIAKSFGYEVSIVNIMFDMSTQDFREKIGPLGSDIIGYSLTSLQIKYLTKFSNAMADLPGVLQIAGGTGATLQPDMQGTRIDGFCVGEGETPLQNLLETIQKGEDVTQVAGFYWHHDGQIRQKAIPTFVKDLDSFDFPDYSLFPNEIVVSGSSYSLSLMISRGCPYKCSFCANEALRGVYETTHGYLRTPSVAYALTLIENVIGHYPQTQFIHFEDDLLIARKSWFISFAEQYRKRIGIPYRMNVRTECLNPQVVDALKESGCVQAFMGVESGNDDYRRKMLFRNHSNEQIIEKARLVKSAGIKLFTFNIMGFPFETREQMLDTYELNRQIQPDNGVCTFFYPFPNTYLWEICVEGGLIDQNQTDGLPSNYNSMPTVCKTDKEKADCIWIVKKTRKYLSQRDMKYRRHQFSLENSKFRTFFFRIRLQVFFFLRNAMSQNMQRRIYHILTTNLFFRRLGAMFLKGIR